MKLDILLVDFALIALVFIPYFAFIIISRRENKKLKEIFFEEAFKHQLKPEDLDRWNNNLIGLDRSRSIILFVQKRKLGIFKEIIDLKEVSSCEILQEINTVKTGKRTENILQRINLQFSFRNNSFREVTLFNYNETYVQDFEMIHAEKWKTRINALLSFQPTINSAA